MTLTSTDPRCATASPTYCFQHFTPPKDSFIGKNILITGSSQGIGRALAVKLASLGAQVILTARSEANLNITANLIEQQNSKIKQTPPETIILPMDLTKLCHHSATDLSQQISTLPELHGELHGLVHCAGELGELTLLTQYPPSTFSRLNQLYIQAPFLLTQALFPLLNQASASSVIFTSSDKGANPKAYWGAYAIAQAGVEAMARVFAAEWANTNNIRCNIVNPGAVKTKLRSEAYPAENPAPLPSPDEILGSYLYLLSDQGSKEKGIRANCQNEKQ